MYWLLSFVVAVAIAPSPAQASGSNNSPVSICAPNYAWSSSGVSPDTAARARGFYRDVTRQYEREQKRARQLGVPLSSEREAQYWNGYLRFMKSIPKHERGIVERGVLPRLSWWCDARPVVARPVSPPRR